MSFINTIRLVMFMGCGVHINAQGYNPGEEVSFNDHVWPRSVSQPVVDFLTDHLSFIDDTSGTNETANAENYVIFSQMFTSDAKCYFPGSVATGVEEIRQLCVTLFSQIPCRHHDLIHAYSFGMNDHEIAEFGSQNYGVDSTDENGGLWEEIISVAATDGELKIKSKRVFVDDDAQL